MTLQWSSFKCFQLDSLFFLFFEDGSHVKLEEIWRLIPSQCLPEMDHEKTKFQFLASMITQNVSSYLLYEFFLLLLFHDEKHSSGLLFVFSSLFFFIKDHPILMEPFYCIHPCHTKTFMDKALQIDDNKPKYFNYIVTWLSSIGPVAGLTINLQHVLKLRQLIDGENSNQKNEGQCSSQLN